jgi:hypothetical protein
VCLHGHVGVWYVTHNAAVQYNKINCSSLYYMYVLQKFIVCIVLVLVIWSAPVEYIIAILSQHLVASLCYTHSKGIMYTCTIMWIGNFLITVLFRKVQPLILILPNDGQ